MRPVYVLLLIACSAAYAQYPARGRISGATPGTCIGSPCIISNGAVITGIDPTSEAPTVSDIPTYGLVINEQAYGAPLYGVSAICLGPELNIDGGPRICASEIRWNGDPLLAKTLTIGNGISVGPVGLDGGVPNTAKITFSTNAIVNDGGTTGSFAFSGALGIRSNSLAVPAIHGSTKPAQAFEIGTIALIGGTRGISFITAFSAPPLCTCTDNSGGAAGAPVSCSTDVPIAGSFNLYGIGTNTVTYSCEGNR